MKKLLAKLFQSTDAENRKAILTLCEEDKSARVLDCGCNDGKFTKELGGRIGTSQIYGIEIAEELGKQAEGAGVKVYLGDLNSLFPVDGDSFDVVCANQVLEHLNHTDLFIREVRRVLKPGGYAVISTPNLAAWHNVFCLLLGWQPFVANLSDEVNIGNPLWPSYKKKAAGGKLPCPSPYFYLQRNKGVV